MGRGIKKTTKFWDFYNPPAEIEKEHAFPIPIEKTIPTGSFSTRKHLWEEKDIEAEFAEDPAHMKTVRAYENLEIREIRGLHFIVEAHDSGEYVRPKFHLDFATNRIPQATDTIWGVITVSIGRRPAKARMIFNDLIREIQERKRKERKC